MMGGMKQCKNTCHSSSGLKWHETSKNRPHGCQAFCRVGCGHTASHQEPGGMVLFLFNFSPFLPYMCLQPIVDLFSYIPVVESHCVALWSIESHGLLF